MRFGWLTSLKVLKSHEFAHGRIMYAVSRRAFFLNIEYFDVDSYVNFSLQQYAKERKRRIRICTTFLAYYNSSVRN